MSSGLQRAGWAVAVVGVNIDSTARAKEIFAARVRDLFMQLVAKGMDPNATVTEVIQIGRRITSRDLKDLCS